MSTGRLPAALIAVAALVLAAGLAGCGDDTASATDDTTTPEDTMADTTETATDSATDADEQLDPEIYTSVNAAGGPRIVDDVELLVVELEGDTVWGWVTVGDTEEELRGVEVGHEVEVEGWTVTVARVGGGTVWFAVVDPDGEPRVG